MKTDLFDYELPENLIAATPAAQRDHSRLLVIERSSRRLTHTSFHEIGRFLPSSSRIFRNNAAVLKARLRGKREGGGAAECLLLHPGSGENTFWCLLKPGKRLREGATIEFETHDQRAFGRVIEKNEAGHALVQFTSPDGHSVTEIAERFGELPLPPYIEKRRAEAEPGTNYKALDEDRYQTRYADPKRKVAAAAPTAGLHFSDSLIEALQAEHTFHNITLHVGLDTFRPIQTDDVEAHPIHREFYEVHPETRQTLHHGTGTRLAIGTTSLRALEDYARRIDIAAPLSPTGTNAFTAEADIYIYPPATFQAVDALITNFHLPRSTLLCLLSAFLTPGSTDGIEWFKQIYQTAIEKDYRFYSYGDAMLIL